ncbi:PTS glucose transporter subunit IIA [Paenibacillus sp. GCM10027626]|uniref:PTS sugar transporter subunit IIA n=1 Tax=Paenibacillus sp. GCM10027626 TaxID=3273411 RepID=UPI003626E0BD
MFHEWFASKKKASCVEAAAPVSGTLLPLCDVPDEVFARGFTGAAIEPSEGLAVAPFDGRVIHLIHTGHAIIVEHQSGLQLLIHIGINTVNLKGRGFNVLVQAGDRVRTGQRLIEFDLKLLRQAGFHATTLIVVINEQGVDMQVGKYRQVRASEPVFRIAMNKFQ